jgi:hypothetical protein
MPHDFQPILDYAFTTSIGMTRAAVYAGSGTIDGPMLRGKVIPMSGGDFPLVRADGVIDFDARYLLEAEDGTVIYLQNRGYRWAKTPEAAERMNRIEAVGRVACRKIPHCHINGVLPNVGNDHAHAGARKYLRHAEPHAAGAPGNERDRALHSFHLTALVYPPMLRLGRLTTLPSQKQK